MEILRRKRSAGNKFKKHTKNKNIPKKVVSIIGTNLIEMNMIQIHKAFYDSHFFQFLEQIIPPTMLTQTSGMSVFGMTLGVYLASAIGLNRELNNPQSVPPDYIHKVKILFRMCKVEGGVYNLDNYPKDIAIEVNNKSVNISKRQPTDITPYVKIHPSIENNIKIFNKQHETSFYLLTVFLARTLDISEIIKNLLAKNIRSEKYTQNKIKELLTKEENELELTSMELSLKCPLSQTVMAIPCQSANCNHLECFEAEYYIKLNLVNGKWVCPICKIHAPPANLVIDGYLLNAVKIVPRDCTCLTLNQDGTCDPRKENNLYLNDSDVTKDFNN